MKLLVALGLILAAPVVRAQQSPPTAEAALDIPKNMSQYFVVLLVHAPGISDSTLPPDLLRRHLAYIRAMIEQKRYLVAGPFLDHDRLVGMAIVAAPTLEEAQRIATNDPTVMEGRLAVEVHPVSLPSLAGITVSY